jgi:hypothetical protein
VTCNIGDLDGTSSATVTLTLNGTTAGEATVTATVTSDTDDGADPNNTASVLTRIGSTSGGGDSGGLCSYNPKGRFDPVLPALLLIGLALIVWRRLATRKR